MRYLSQSLVRDVVRCKPKPVDANQDVIWGKLRWVWMYHQYRRDFMPGGYRQPWHSESYVFVRHGQG